jgi:hypothetical protein
MPIEQITQIIANISTTLATITGIVAAIFIVVQIYSMKKSREVDVFLRIYEITNTKDFLDASLFIKTKISKETTYVETNTPEYRNSLSIITNYFEMVGILVNKKYISNCIIYDQMGTWIVGTWNKIEKIIKSHRVEKNNPQYAENFEMLATMYDDWAKMTPLKLEKRKRISGKAVEDFYSK